jgi:diadenosine tetraphosphate (Ap4A) HIT family hydrolase
VFALDSRLQQDSLVLGDLAAVPLAAEQGCQLPWFILVPRRADISELFELDEADQQQLWQETNALAEALKDAFAPTR